MLSQRQKAEAEVERIRRHLRRIGKKSYRHLHVYVNRMNRAVVYYTRTKPQTEIKAHPIKDPPGFHAEYWRAHDGGPNGGGEPTSTTRRITLLAAAAGTWNAAFDAVEKSPDLIGKKRATKRAYRSTLKLARQVLGNMRMSTTKPYYVEDFINTAAANNQNAANLLTVLKKAYRIGLQRGWTTCDLMANAHVPKKEKREDDQYFYRPYEAWEIEQWRATYPIGSMPRLCFELAYNQSLPRSDVIRIAPCHIGRNDAGELTIVGLGRRKTGVLYNSVITSPDLIACLDAYPPPAEGEIPDRLGRSTTPYLRKLRSGEPFVPGHLINDDAACEKGASLIGQYWRRWANKAKLPEDFRLHAGRHTYAFDAALAGIDGKETMRVLGQTDVRIHERYKQGRDAQVAGQRASRAVAKFRQGGQGE